MCVKPAYFVKSVNKQALPIMVPTRWNSARLMVNTLVNSFVAVSNIFVTQNAFFFQTISCDGVMLHSENMDVNMENMQRSNVSCIQTIHQTVQPYTTFVVDGTIVYLRFGNHGNPNCLFVAESMSVYVLQALPLSNIHQQPTSYTDPVSST